MKLTTSLFGCAVLALAVGCSDEAGDGDGDGESGPGGDPNVDLYYCNDWAKTCPADIGDDGEALDQCKSICEGDESNFDIELCWVTYCMLEVGMCIEDEGSYDSVVACAEIHGWR